MGYAVVPSEVRSEVEERDNRRCRWCARTNVGYDLHHIRYRRGTSDDVPGNLICLCRECHNFVHGARLYGTSIAKVDAQEILWALVDSPGKTGMSLFRKHRKKFCD